MSYFEEKEAVKISQKKVIYKSFDFCWVAVLCWVVMGGGEYILTSRGCWWVVVNIYYLVMDYGERWWVVLGCGGYILVGGGWW